MSATSEWVVASAATEHTGEPQLAGNVCTHNASSATEHADPAHEFENVELQSAEWRSVATEHADDPDDALVLTIDDASQIRRTFKGQPGELKDSMLQSR